MSWHFSRALVEEFSAVTCLDGELSAPSNSMPTQEAFFWPDKTTEHSRLSRFGMTSEPLTVALGEAVLTSFRAAFRARTLARQAKELASTESAAGSGPKWRGSFARFDPASSTWKTPQCSLLGDWDEFSETWPRWGSMRNGESYLRPIPALPICESASGLWQTPVADDAVNRVNGKWNSRGEPKLSAQVLRWPTPKANDAEKRGNFDVNNPRNGLPAAAKKWPTPTACMHKGSSEASLTRKDGQSRENDRLDHAVMASDGGQLNPNWVEWLMGWPIGWTDLKPLETGRFQEWLALHGTSCLKETEDELAA